VGGEGIPVGQPRQAGRQREKEGAVCFENKKNRRTKSETECFGLDEGEGAEAFDEKEGARLMISTLGEGVGGR